jgi:hypothetical protein
MRLRWTHILTAMLLGAICFGGTFTCNKNNNDNKSTVTVN